MSRFLTIDSHVDIEPYTFRADCNYTQRLATQVDLPKMEEGGLNAVFFVVFASQGPLTQEGYANGYRQAVAKFDAIHRLTDEMAPQRVGLARTPDELVSIAASGRRVVVIGVENGYPIANDIGRVREFYDRGGRYLSLTHNGHNQLCDSCTGEKTGDPPNGGLSAFGRDVIAEMNRLGMMVDVSHLSRASMLQAAEASTAPIIASHSAVRALVDHGRNLDDEQLLAVKKTGGVVQIVAYPGFLRSDDLADVRALMGAAAALRAEFGVERRVDALPEDPPGATPCPKAGSDAEGPEDGDRRALAALGPEALAAYRSRGAAMLAGYRSTMRASVADLVDHIDYVVKLLGVDHVGIASDFEGGGGIRGWNNAAETPNVTAELVRRGYSDPDIAKIWGANLLRVWREVER